MEGFPCVSPLRRSEISSDGAISNGASRHHGNASIRGGEAGCCLFHNRKDSKRIELACHDKIMRKAVYRDATPVCNVVVSTSASWILFLFPALLLLMADRSQKLLIHATFTLSPTQQRLSTCGSSSFS